MLINAQRTGKLIRRLFDGSNRTILGELLQNSQRAGASRVDLTFSENQFSLQDNGTGICVTPDPIIGFNALLRVAESLYQNPEIEENQKPMGVGINALLGHESVQCVTFRSNGYQVEINLDTWWETIDETNHWQSLIQPDPNPITGFAIKAVGSIEWVKAMETALKDVKTDITTNGLRLGPAQGYEGILDVYSNGEQLVKETQLPKIPAYIQQFSATYQSCPVTFYFADSYKTYHTLVNWYGQLINVNNLELGNIGVIMEVARGMPVSPKAPTRDGLVQDRQLQSWRQWIEDTLFAAVESQTLKATPEVLRALNGLNTHRFKTECSFFIASEIQPYDGDTDDDEVRVESVFNYRDAPLLLEREFEIKLPDLDQIEIKEWSDWDADPESQTITSYYGIGSFVKMIGQPYFELTLGNADRLSIGKLQWRCGDRLEDASNKTEIPFYKPGEWRIDQSSPEWQPVTQSVFSFASSYCGFRDIEWIFGTNNPPQCLEENGWAAYSSPESEESLAREGYEESLDEAIRSLLPNSIPANYNQSMLEYYIRRWHQAEAVEVQAIRFVGEKLVIEAIVDNNVEEISATTYGS